MVKWMRSSMPTGGWVAALIGAVTPFLLAAAPGDTLAHLPSDAPMWLLVAGSALATPATWLAYKTARVTFAGAAAFLRSWGQRLKTDKNPSNDPLGDALIRAAEELEKDDAPKGQ